MGCGGSKQKDVAAGNTVTRRALRGSYSAVKGNEAAAAVADGAEKAQLDEKLAPKDSSSEEFFSSRREVEGLDAMVAGTEVADDLYLAEQTAAVSEKEGSTLAMLEKKKEKIAGNNEDDGKSIGNLSVEFKEEAISMDEKEAEAPTTENKITQVARTTTEEIAKATTNEEKKNSGENKTR